MAGVQFYGVRTSAAMQIQRPRVNYKPYAETIVRTDLNGVPEPLRAGVEKLYAMAERTGLLNEAKGAIRDFGKLDNNYLLFFVRRLHDAIESGALSGKRDFETMASLMHEHPAAADSIPQYMVNLQDTLGDRFHKLSADDLGRIARKTISRSASLCPTEMMNTTVAMVQRGEFEDVQQIAELRHEMKTETATASDTISITISDCQTINVNSSANTSVDGANSKQITPSQIQTEMREATVRVSDYTYRTESTAQNSRADGITITATKPVAITVESQLQTPTFSQTITLNRTPTPIQKPVSNTRDTVSITVTERHGSSLVQTPNQAKIERNRVHQPTKLTVVEKEGPEQQKKDNVTVKPAMKAKRPSGRTRTRTKTRITATPQFEKKEQIAARSSYGPKQKTVPNENTNPNANRKRQVLVHNKKIRTPTANAPDKRNKAKTAKKTRSTMSDWKQEAKNRAKKREPTSKRNKSAQRTALPNLEPKNNSMRAMRTKEVKIKAKRPRPVQTMRQPRNQNRLRVQHKEKAKRERIERRTARGKKKPNTRLMLGILLAGWRTTRIRRGKKWQRR